MPQNRIVVLASVALIIFDLIWLFVRIKKNGIISKDQRTNKFYITIASGYLMALLLLIILLFREFGLMSDCILAGCCVLGIEVENRILLGSVSMYDDNSAYNQ